MPPLTSNPHRLSELVALGALAALYLSGVGTQAFVDPDIWHEMALIREALALGHLPLEDPFAYTPTIVPVVHHEWGTGAILYFVAKRAGSGGILALKCALAVATGVGCMVCAHRRGAGLPVLCALTPLAIFLCWLGFATVRAQMFTLLLMVHLLYCLDRDREGKRRWIVPWLGSCLLWVNLHAGFFVGFVLVVLHTAEQLIRRRPIRHLIAVQLAMVAIVAVNPYGLDYFPYLWKGLLLNRPLITEWAPLWDAGGVIMVVFLFSLLVVAYAMHKIGFRSMPGLVLLLVTAAAALRHQRHVSLYAITWWCHLPAFIARTQLGDELTRLWGRRPRTTLRVWSLVAAVTTFVLVMRPPTKLLMPANPGDHRLLTYPVGAVQYLDQVGFHGNLMVQFTTGAFVTWKLHPEVKVSIDGRYEVAYPPGALEESARFYAAKPGWQQTLGKYPTDAVLVPTSGRLADAMPQAQGWTRVYRDDAYEVYARPGLTLPHVDRRGERFAGTFP